MSEVIRGSILAEVDNWAKSATLTGTVGPSTYGTDIYKLVDGNVGYKDYVTLLATTDIEVDFGELKTVHKLGVYFTPVSTIFDVGIVPRNATNTVQIQYYDGIGWTPISALEWRDFNYRYGLEESVRSSDGTNFEVDAGILTLYFATGVSASKVKFTFPNESYVTQIEATQVVELDVSSIRVNFKRDFDKTSKSAEGEIVFRDETLSYLPTLERITFGDALWFYFDYNGEGIYYGGFRVLDYETDIETRYSTISFTDRMWPLSDANINIDTSAYLLDDMRKPIEDLLNAAGIHKDIVTVPELPANTYIPRYESIKSELDRLLESLGDVELFQDKNGRITIVSRNDTYYTTVQSGSGTEPVLYANTYAGHWQDIIFSDKFIYNPYVKFSEYNPVFTWTAGPGGAYGTQAITGSEKVRTISVVSNSLDPLNQPDLEIEMYLQSATGSLKFSIEGYSQTDVSTGTPNYTETRTVDFGAGGYTDVLVELTVDYEGTNDITLTIKDTWGAGATIFSETWSPTRDTDRNTNVVMFYVEGVPAATAPEYQLTRVREFFDTYGNYTQVSGNEEVFAGYATYDLVIQTEDCANFITYVVNYLKSLRGIPVIGYELYEYFQYIKPFVIGWDNGLSEPIGDWKENITDVAAAEYVKVRLYVAWTNAFLYLPETIVYSKTTGGSAQRKQRSIYVKGLAYKATSRYSSESLIFNDFTIANTFWNTAASEEVIAEGESETLDIGQRKDYSFVYDEAVDISTVHVKVNTGGTEYDFPINTSADDYTNATINMRIKALTTEGISKRYYLGIDFTLYNDIAGSINRTFSVKVYGKKLEATTVKVPFQNAESIAKYGKIAKTIDNDLISGYTAYYVAKKYQSFANTPILIPQTVMADLNLDLDLDTILTIIDPINNISLDCELYEIEHRIDAENLQHETGILAKNFNWSDYTGNANYYNMRVPLWIGTFDEFTEEATEGEYAKILLTDEQGGGYGYYVKIDGVVRDITTDLIIQGQKDEAGVFRATVPIWYDTYNSMAATLEEGGMRLIQMPGTDGKNWICKIDGELQIFA